MKKRTNHIHAYVGNKSKVLHWNSWSSSIQLNFPDKLSFQVVFKCNKKCVWNCRFIDISGGLNCILPILEIFSLVRILLNWQRQAMITFFCYWFRNSKCFFKRRRKKTKKCAFGSIFHFNMITARHYRWNDVVKEEEEEERPFVV